MARLWKEADFRRLWAGQTASQLGEHTALVVLPLFAVLTLDAGAGELGALRAVGQAPVLLLSLFAGAWARKAPQEPAKTANSSAATTDTGSS